VVTRQNFALRCVLVALVSWALFVLLGMYVVRNGEPAALAALQQSLVNHSTLLAWWITWSCYVQVIGPIAILLLIVALLVKTWRTRILFSIVMLLLCWRVADFLQHYFARPRPMDWVVKHETAFSYPSSHAAIAFGFYGLWAVMIYWSDLSAGVRRVGALLLAVLTVAICWSRLALGAHYVTDLLGGALLAIGLVAAGLALVPIAPFRIAGRS
jgi:membrane-associated phospholipid phosphatase